MRVGVMTPGLSVGDAIGNDVVGIYETARRKGLDAYIFTPDGRSGTAFQTHAYADLPWILRSERDLLIYHLCTYDPSGLKALQRRSGRLMIKYHNITPSHHMSRWSIDFARATRSAREALPDFVALPVDHYCSDSFYNGAELAKLGAPAKLSSVCPPFHHIGEMLGRAEHPPTLAALTPYANNVLAVGRVVPNKGLAEMIEAFVRFMERGGPPAHLHVVGSFDSRMTSYHDALRVRLKEAGRASAVSFHGAVGLDALATFFRRCDLFWTSSLHEGFCVPAVEAMAFGKPVLSTTAGALPETCGDGAVYADTPSAMAEGLHRLLSDDGDRLALGRVGRARYLERFQHGVVRRTFEALLNRVVAQGEARVDPRTLDASGDWFGLPDAERLTAEGLAVADPSPPLLLIGRDRRLDFLNWAFVEGARRSPALAAYFGGLAFKAYAEEIEVPRAAAHLNAEQRFLWFTSRFARASFDLSALGGVWDFLNWARREGAARGPALRAAE